VLELTKVAKNIAKYMPLNKMPASDGLFNRFFPVFREISVNSGFSGLLHGPLMHQTIWAETADQQSL
jgi:hypothetical protein